MKQRFLVDGYNVVHALGLSERLGAGGLQRARERLLALIHRRCAGAEVTVVFDGNRTSAPRQHHGITVHFSKGEADELIRDLVAHDSAPRSLCVVSSDRAVQTAARRRHAGVMEAEVFVRHLESREQPRPAAAPEKPAPNDETQHWLEAFGDIDRDPAVQAMQRIEPLGLKRNPKKKK